MANYCQIFFLLFIIIIIPKSTSFDTNNPSKLVQEICKRTEKKESNSYSDCISVFNTGAAWNGDLRSLSYYTRDFADNNATSTLDKINTQLIPNQPDPYIQEVLNVCKDAFTRLQDELVNRVNPMIVEKGTFREAKAWVDYGIGLMDSCKSVCNAQPNTICLLDNDVRDTKAMLIFLDIVLQLLIEGVM
ncbi:unnamed protein product [Amaranthus hypochondriacus]